LDQETTYIFRRPLCPVPCYAPAHAVLALAPATWVFFTRAILCRRIFIGKYSDFVAFTRDARFSPLVGSRGCTPRESPFQSILFIKISSSYSFMRLPRFGPFRRWFFLFDSPFWSRSILCFESSPAAFLPPLFLFVSHPRALLFLSKPLRLCFLSRVILLNFLRVLSVFFSSSRHTPTTRRALLKGW